MLEVIRKARKNYICVYCEDPILKDDLYKSFKGKSARYDLSLKQIGIEYYHERLCYDVDKCNSVALEKGFIDQ